MLLDSKIETFATGFENCSFKRKEFNHSWPRYEDFIEVSKWYAV